MTLSPYLQRVAKNILPLSRNKTDVVVAMKEWAYYGERSDAEDAVTKCEVCDHYPVRYQFQIVNRFTQERLEIGSECITRFDVPVVDDDGEILQGEDAAKKVAKDKRSLQEESRKWAVRRALITLAKVDTVIEKDMLFSLASAADERGLSPKQASMLLWRFKENGISLPPSYLKVMLKKNNEKDALLAMEDWKVQHLWPCLTPAQKRWYQIEKPAFDSRRARLVNELRAKAGLPPK